MDSVERVAIVAWLRKIAQARDDRADPEWAAALFEAAEFIERGEHLTQHNSSTHPGSHGPTNASE